MDHIPKEVRSRIMAAVHSRGNTTTELPLARLLWAAGFRGYRKHWPVAGKPDFAWPGRRVAVFVDGCFWHGCRCKYLPRTNTEFWRDKIETNKRRDWARLASASARRMDRYKGEGVRFAQTVDARTYRQGVARRRGPGGCATGRSRFLRRSGSIVTRWTGQEAGGGLFHYFRKRRISSVWRSER